MTMHVPVRLLSSSCSLAGPKTIDDMSSTAGMDCIADNGSNQGPAPAVNRCMEVLWCQQQGAEGSVSLGN